MEFTISFPLDPDGFLRRACPSCDREFKWFSGRTEGAPDDWIDPPEYFCPYCARPAAEGWYTHAQVAMMEEAVADRAADVVGDALDETARRINRRGKGIKMSTSGRPRSRTSPPLSEPNDMVGVEPPCHPFEPVKVLEGWSEPLHCLVCGSAFVLE
jgi:hypothetical protein